MSTFSVTNGYYCTDRFRAKLISDFYPRGFTAYLGNPFPVLKLRRCPSSVAAPPRGFTFYVAPPGHSFLPFSFLLPQYTAV
jgi:hypothetical protein